MIHLIKYEIKTLFLSEDIIWSPESLRLPIARVGLHRRALSLISSPQKLLGQSCPIWCLAFVWYSTANADPVLDRAPTRGVLILPALSRCRISSRSRVGTPRGVKYHCLAVYADYL